MGLSARPLVSFVTIRKERPTIKRRFRFPALLTKVRKDPLVEQTVAATTAVRKEWRIAAKQTENRRP